MSFGKVFEIALDLWAVCEEMRPIWLGIPSESIVVGLRKSVYRAIFEWGEDVPECRRPHQGRYSLLLHQSHVFLQRSVPALTKPSSTKMAVLVKQCELPAARLEHLAHLIRKT
jgi:hypothetical protein